MNEFDKMKLRREEFKENEFLRAYNNAPEHIRRVVLCALGIHDELKNESEGCKVYNFKDYI